MLEFARTRKSENYCNFGILGIYFVYAFTINITLNYFLFKVFFQIFSANCFPFGLMDN